jgi:hypothetical protein
MTFSSHIVNSPTSFNGFSQPPGDTLIMTDIYTICKFEGTPSQPSPNITPSFTTGLPDDDIGSPMLSPTINPTPPSTISNPDAKSESWSYISISTLVPSSTPLYPDDDGDQASPSEDVLLTPEIPYIGEHTENAFNSLDGIWRFDRWINNYKTGSITEQWRGTATFTSGDFGSFGTREKLVREEVQRLIGNQNYKLHREWIWHYGRELGESIVILFAKDGKVVKDGIYQTITLHSKLERISMTRTALNAHVEFGPVCKGKNICHYTFLFDIIPHGYHLSSRNTLCGFEAELTVENESERYRMFTRYERPV